MKKNSRTVVMAGAALGGAIAAWRAWKKHEIRKKSRSAPPNRRIVILGAGFAGLNTARQLARLLPDHDRGRITLVDQNNFLLFTPMLTEVAGGELDARHIVAPPRQLSPRVRFEQGKVTTIDLAKRSVTLEVEPGVERTLAADHLVIALGSTPNYHGIAGVREHSVGMKSVRDALEIRNRVLAGLERAATEQDAGRRRAALTFVVAGGGFTGVETMAAINDLARESVGNYPSIAPDDIAAYLVEPGERLLAELNEDLAAFAQQKLEERGVRVMLNTKIAVVGDGFVELEGGRRIETRLLVWAAGVMPNPLVKELPCRKGKHGGIAVDACCAAPDYPGVWALGDCAEVPKPQGDGTYAPTAQNATREGELVARNIVAALCGEAPRPFAFHTIGELALVGRHAGVGEIYGRKFSGLLAWAMWRAVYLAKIPGMAQRSRILLDWMLDFIFGRSIAELPVE
jgi:NADH:ubiquinone reductase (H+-translocating)